VYKETGNEAMEGTAQDPAVELVLWRAGGVETASQVRSADEE